MIFEEIRSGGCCSYVIACGETCAGVVVDPELSQVDRTLALIAKAGVRVHYVIDTHTHADHPGHDYKGAPVTTIGQEKAENPRLQNRERVATGGGELVVLDVRERDAYDGGHIAGARHVPRGQLELRIDQTLRDATVRIVTCCEFGKISTLTADTLRAMGYVRTVALDGGMKAWREAGYPVESTAARQ